MTPAARSIKKSSMSLTLNPRASDEMQIGEGGMCSNPSVWKRHRNYFYYASDSFKHQRRVKSIGARVQRNSSIVIRVWKQLIGEYRTTRKTDSGRRKVTSVRDDRHTLRMAVNDRAASSMQLAAHWSTTAGVIMSA
ncbi:uncharacterized protein TNCV_1317471 [Trichonephila clavipes]|nr:uncharacterized protein TNCV_1317471 [Trichonephila clavipes]